MDATKQEHSSRSYRAVLLKSLRKLAITEIRESSIAWDVSPTHHENAAVEGLISAIKKVEQMNDKALALLESKIEAEKRNALIANLAALLQEMKPAEPVTEPQSPVIKNIKLCSDCKKELAWNDSATGTCRTCSQIEDSVGIPFKTEFPTLVPAAVKRANQTIF